MSRYRLDEKMIRPAIYNLNFDFDGIAFTSDIAFWGWVKIPDLVSCVNRMFANKNISVRDVEIFERYGLLCRMLDDKPLYTWANTDGFEIDGQKVPNNYANTFIPAGWSDRIINAARNDIIRVTASAWIEHEIDGGWKNGFFGVKKKDPFLGPILKKWQKIGHCHDGKKMVICFNGEGGSTTKEAPTISLYN